MTDYKDDSIWLMKGDCLERMKEIQSGSVDMALADVPYGATACAWDSIIPLEPMWGQLKRIIKPNGAIVMTASQPFTTSLVASNIKQAKHFWVWIKERGTGFQVAKYRPMMATEDVCVFVNGRGTLSTYNPQMTPLENPRIEKFARSKSGSSPIANMKQGERIVTERYPVNTLTFKRDKSKIHPTQKPVALMEYLIKTYTNEGETVLDFTAGSFTTGVACVNLNRKFIGIELDRGYFDIGVNRIKERINCLGLKIEPEISMGG